MAGLPENMYSKATIINTGMFSRSLRCALQIKTQEEIMLKHFLKGIFQPPKSVPPSDFGTVFYNPSTPTAAGRDCRFEGFFCGKHFYQDPLDNMQTSPGITM